MHVSLASPANSGAPDRTLPDAEAHAHTGRELSPKRHDGNFVTGCLVGAACATVLWAAIGYAFYSLL